MAVERVVTSLSADDGGAVAASLLVLPLLQLVSAGRSRGQGDGWSSGGYRKMVVGATSALQAVEKLLNGKLQPVVPPKTAVRPASLHLFAASLEHYTLTQLTSAVTGGGDSLNVSSQLTCTVAAMLVIDRTLEVTQRALDVLIHIARLDKTKFCIAPILKTIQALMSSPKLQPVAIRLMTTLWEIQDRCFPQLLKAIDFEGFLSSMVGKEVDDLPRGIYHSATRRYGTAGSQDKAIASIPAFLATQYEKTKQPGLRPSLAAGLLFCHDPAVEVGRDGRPRKHYLVKHGKQFLDMFKTLLNEIPIQPSEWHRMMLMPQAWASFVERLFHALIESRKAELELQVKHGHISHDQLAEKTNTAWLFARDAIVDVLKTSSR
nr:hypothetical protein BaRGS_035216 [Batillaria attramentaria]